MKKLTALALCRVLLFSMTGCSIAEKVVDSVLGPAESAPSPAKIIPKAPSFLHLFQNYIDFLHPMVYNISV